MRLAVKAASNVTIARRLVVLLTVPLVALLGLGVFTRLQLAEIEARSRLVAESRIVALATRRAAPFYDALGYEDSAVYFRKLL